MTSPSEQQRPRGYFLIYSRSSGRQRWVDDAALIRNFFREKNIPHEFVEVDRREHTLADLDWSFVDETGAAVVAIGGDGILRAVTEHLFLTERKVPIGVIPRGSANVFARLHGVPRSVPAALEHLMQAQPSAHSIGLLNGKHVFLLGACYGRLAEITLAAENRLKRTLGFGCYLLEGAKRILRFPRHPLQLGMEQGEESLLAHSLLVCTPMFARATLPANGEGHLLRAVAVANASPFGLMHSIVDLYIRKSSSKRVLHASSPWFSVRGDLGKTFHLDGDSILLEQSEHRLELIEGGWKFLV